jgi:hypothetical protein
MSAAATLAPKKPRWFAASAGVSIAAVMVYFALALWQPWGPGRFWGLAFGIAAAVLFANAGLYPLRRRWLARPWRNVQTWLQLHIYGSVVALLFVVIHMGFRWPTGQMGWWLFGLSLWTTISGLIGVWLQKSVPITLSRQLKVEAIYERIPEMIERLSAEAAALVAGASDALRRGYERDIRPLLAGPAPRWGYVFDFRGARARLLERLTNLEKYVPDADRDRLRDLVVLVNEKLDFDVHLSLQRALRTWLVTHVPAAMLLLALLVVHIGAVVYF